MHDGVEGDIDGGGNYAQRNDAGTGLKQVNKRPKNQRSPGLRCREIATPALGTNLSGACVWVQPAAKFGTIR